MQAKKSKEKVDIQQINLIIKTSVVPFKLFHCLNKLILFNYDLFA